MLTIFTGHKNAFSDIGFISGQQMNPSFNVNTGNYGIKSK